MERICILGLGYVGLTLAVAMARAGFRVHGVERSEHVRSCVLSGRAHFFEQGLDELLAGQVKSGQLTCSETLPEAGTVSVYIVTVGTPLTKEGMVDLASFHNVMNAIASVLRDGDTVILRSTVKIGTTRTVSKTLDKVGVPYNLAFCPERTLEGKALEELSSLPQIVGGINSSSSHRASQIFSKITNKTIVVDRPEAAEMIKLVNNTHRDLMFAFSNEIAEMCDAVGISAMQVIRGACDGYPRSKIAVPGPVGGPCLEKDTHILVESMKQFDYTPAISLAGRKLNENLPHTAAKAIVRAFERAGSEAMPPGDKISILGLAFKGEPETDDLRGSMARHILSAVRSNWPESTYFAYDSMVDEPEFRHLEVNYCAKLEDAFKDARLIIIQNNHREFGKMDICKLSRTMGKPGVIYDFWNLFDRKNLELGENVVYLGLGVSA